MVCVKDLCRFCTKYTNSTLCLNHTDTDEVKFIDKLKFIFNDLILKEDSTIPFQICSPCCEKIKQTYDFKKQCSSSYAYWKMHLTTTTTTKTIIQQEPVENLQSEKLPAVRKRGRPKKVKTETENQLVIDNVKNKLSRPKKIKIENQLLDDNLKNKLESVKKNNSELNPNILNLKNKLSTLLKPKIEIKKEIPNEVVAPIQLSFTSLKSKLGNALKIGVQNIKEEKITPKSITKKRVAQNYYSINKSFYIIDIKRKRFYCKSCNKYFLNLKSLKVHIVQDLGIKNVPCRLCRKRFFSRRELKLHMKKHKL